MTDRGFLVVAIFLLSLVMAFPLSAHAKLIEGLVDDVNVKTGYVDVRWTDVLKQKENVARVFFTPKTQFENVTSPDQIKKGDRIVIDCYKHTKTLEWMAKKIKMPDPKSLKTKARSLLKGL